MDINACQFFIKATDEPFVKNLYSQWDAFFDKSFVNVFEEVFSSLDVADDIWQIERLELDLGVLPQDKFAESFASSLREKLKELAFKMVQNEKSVNINGISCESVRKPLSLGAFEMFTYFLMHGNLPEGADSRFSNLQFLLRQTLLLESERLHVFLESYGHYDFIVNRLVLQLDDEDLELLLSKVRPSESKFICLYVRLHLINHKEHRQTERRRPFIERGVYRDILWQLVFSYLYSEGKGYFSRKQFIIYTIKGMSSHYNLSFPAFVEWMTDSLDELRILQTYKPEFLSLLLEIADENVNTRSDFSIKDNSYIKNLLSSLSQTFNSERGGEEYLSMENLVILFSNETYLQEILPSMDEMAIKKVVSLLFPTEKDFILTYANELEKCKNKGVLDGKCGNDFRYIKWKFIFLVSLEYPQTQFARQTFVCSVLVRLANHYNVTLIDLIHLFLPVVETQMKSVFASSLLDILLDLSRLFSSSERKTSISAKKEIRLSEAEWVVLLHDTASSEHYISFQTDEIMEDLISDIRPAESRFIITYSRLLEQKKSGLFEGRAGDGFRVLKWRFLLSCLLIPQGVVFSRKAYILRVIQSLALHYNFSTVELLACFVHLLPLKTNAENTELASIIKELYDEHFLSLSSPSSSSVRMSEQELERWLKNIFGETPIDDEYRKRWLLFAMHQNSALVARLWRSGDLLPLSVLRLLRGDARLQLSFLKAIGDSRMDKLYSQAQAFFRELKRVGVSDYQLNKLSVEALFVMVQLTHKRHLSWSFDEMRIYLMRQLSVDPIRKELIASLQEKIYDNDKTRTMDNPIAQIKEKRLVLEKMNEFNPMKEKKNEIVQEQQRWSVQNAGMVLISPFFPRLFQYAGYLNEKMDNFLDDTFRIRAVFLLQYVVTGNEVAEYEEAELYLNHILVSLPETVPLPKCCELTAEEKKLAHSMLNGIKTQWSKMTGTSEQAFRQTFLCREGILSLKDQNAWQLTVKEMAFDVLLETVPWSFRMFRYGWMDKLMNVTWR